MSSPEDSTSLSFEQLLGWMGRFTPQFKFRLMTFRRVLPHAQFDSLVRDSLGVFRRVMVELARTPKGIDRARRVYAMIDQEFQATPPKNVSCGEGCGACCRFPKQITDDEADLLASLVLAGQAMIHPASLEKGGCPFLDGENRCSVYNDRPSTCRKYHVTSPRESCASDDGTVVPHIELMPEIIVSAAMSLPDNDIGMMNDQLARRLQR